jgi:VWFA-related protein
MRKRPIILAFLLCFAVLTGFGQSGRKISAPPKPAAEPETSEPDYSESTPKPKRQLIYPPGWNRSGEKPASAPIIADKTEDSPEGEVRVETNLVMIPVSVFDRNGLYVPNLRQSDFRVFEDGKEQPIAYFGRSEAPFTVALLLDTSPSTAYKIDEIREAARAFVDLLKPQDSVIVIEFDGNVHVLAERTSDREKIYKAIKRADFGGGTALYDAVDFALRKQLSQIEGRKAIVLFTDGVDTQSRKASYDSTLAIAEESDVLIFPVYYNTFFDNRPSIYSPFPPMISIGGGRGTSAEEYAIGKKYLEDLADYTGGRVFRPESTPGGLRAAFEGIAEELRSQYQLGYVPADEGKPGQRKQIKVRVNRPNLIVRARDSYIVGAPSGKQ